MKKLTSTNTIVAICIVAVFSLVAVALSFQSSEDHSNDNHGASNHQGHSHGTAQFDDGTFTTAAAEYTCSMHPSFRTTDPNERCPICGMELIPVASGSAEDDDSISIEFSGRSLALLGVQTEPAARGNAQQHIRLTGQLDFDERALTSISAWTGGRIERLYVNYTGAHVNAGDPLVEIYSPELLVAQQDLLQAEALASQEGPAFLRDSQVLTLRAARERLRLLGLNESQINEIVRRGHAQDRITIYAPSAGLVVRRGVSQGDYVNRGDTLLELADGTQYWALFEAFERDLGSISIGQELRFTIAGHELAGKVVSVAPRIDPERRTRQIRVAIDTEHTGEGLVAGAFTQAHVQVDVADVLTIPRSAPLITGKRAVVYIQSSAQEGTFEARTVELGRRMGERYEVLSGLEVGELVVSRGAFRIDSELQLRGRPSMMAPVGGGTTGHEQHGHADVNSGAATEPHQHEQQTLSADTVSADIAVEPVLQAYYGLWEALQGDDLATWQVAAEQFHEQVAAVNWPQSLASEREQLEQGKGHVHHVTDMATAREHFYAHSQAMIRLAEAGLHHSDAYLMYCPMARRGEGAHWLQPSAELLNPYYGAMMLRCGDQVAVLEGQGGHH